MTWVYFNPLPRKEGDSSTVTTPSRLQAYFNPLPRKEGDMLWSKSVLEQIPISIHSLVKRETFVLAALAIQRVISIHSLVKRETQPVPFASCRCWHFNPLPRKEGDSGIPARKGKKYFISIHSLVKRETNLLCYTFLEHAISIHSLVKRETTEMVSFNGVLLYFNPLPRKEGDCSICKKILYVSIFQSTPS